MAVRSNIRKKSGTAEAYNMPPQNTDAEKCVLGSILLQPRTILKVIEKLTPDDFYLEIHRIIYEAMVALFNRSQPQDIITVTNALRDSKQLDKVGGAVYVTSLTDIVPVTANITHYMDIILEKSILTAADCCLI